MRIFAYGADMEEHPDPNVSDADKEKQEPDEPGAPARFYIKRVHFGLKHSTQEFHQAMEKTVSPQVGPDRVAPLEGIKVDTGGGSLAGEERTTPSCAQPDYPFRRGVWTAGRTGYGMVSPRAEMSRWRELLISYRDQRE
jgi:hypothetical protein